MGLCRLCARLHRSDHLINIQEDWAMEISRKVEICCCVVIQLDDYTWPTTVCKLCVKLLNKFYDFYVKVQRAQIKLRKFLISNQTTVKKRKINATLYANAVNKRWAKTHEGKQLFRCVEQHLGTRDAPSMHQIWLESENRKLENLVCKNSNKDINGFVSEVENLNPKSHLPSMSKQSLKTQELGNDIEDNNMITLFRQSQNDSNTKCSINFGMPSMSLGDKEYVATTVHDLEAGDSLFEMPKNSNTADVIHLSDSEIEESSMDTFLNQGELTRFSIYVDSEKSRLTLKPTSPNSCMRDNLLATPVTVDNEELIAANSQFVTEKNNSSAMDDEDMEFGNHDSELNDNVLTVLDIVSDTEDTVSDNDEDYLQEISDILGKAQHKQSVNLEPEEHIIKASSGENHKDFLWKGESETSEVSGTTIKREQLDQTEEKAQQCIEKDEDCSIDEKPNINMLDNVLKQKTACAPRVSEYQSMDEQHKQKTPCAAKDKVYHSMVPEFVQHVRNEIKTEIILDEHQADDNQNGTVDTVRVQNTNEIFYIYEYSPPQLDQQQLTSWKSYKYLCGSCDYTTNDLRMLSQHSNYAHVNMFYKCADCLKTIYNYHDLLSHVQTQHHPRLKLRCDACDLLCVNEIEYGLHRHVHCLHAKRLPNYSQCPYCSRIFGKNKWKHTHIRMNLKPTPEIKLQCKYCDQESLSRCALDQHEITHNMTKEAMEDNLACDFCRDIFVENEIPNVQVETVFDKMFFACHICKQFNTDNAMDLKGHLENHAIRRCNMCRI